MIIGPLDLGAPSHPWAKPETGQVVGSILVEGYDTIVYPRGSIARKQTVSFWIKEWQAIGGQSANSQAAVKLLVRQLEELAGNRDYQPVLIQFNASADPAAILNATEYHDGWYVIDDFEPDYQNFVVSGLVQCRMTVTYVAAAAPRRTSVWYSGAALSSNFSGGALNLISLPIGSTALETNFNRVAAEGNIPCILSPAVSPEPTVFSATLSNIYKGGVHVYDTINTGSNPVPTSGGTFVNANWVEVFGTDHDFVGDCVITNGLLLLLFQAAGSNVPWYLWNTALAVANWQQLGSLNYLNNAGVSGIVRQYSLVRVGPEESAISVILSTSTGQVAQTTMRLQRGRYEGRVDFRPLNEAETSNFSFIAQGFPATLKIDYNSSHIADNALAEASPVAVTDYGYGATFIANTSYPFIAGLLYQNQPGSNQPYLSGSTYIGLGDTTSLAINAQRSYGFFGIPYGVSGSYSTANLQAEAESGTLAAGWSSQANASASAANEAKCASGTVTGHDDIFGTAFQPQGGLYDIWFRVKVTSAAGVQSEMQLGWWNSTDSVFVASTTFQAQNVTTSYAWYRVAHNVQPTLGKNMRFRAVTTATIGTDWFVDEAAAAFISGSSSGPQDIAQEFLYDRGARWTRP